jgi:hypothetical protein
MIADPSHFGGDFLLAAPLIFPANEGAPPPPQGFVLKNSSIV